MAQAEAFRAIAWDHDRSDLATALSHQILSFLKLNTPTELVNWLYSPERPVAEGFSIGANCVRGSE